MGNKDYFREISVKLLFKPFYWSGLSANAITMINFWVVELAAIALFLIGYDLLGLSIGGLAAMIDYIDGSIARARGGNSKLGQYLDTSSDWLYLMLLIGAISYHHQILPLGYITLIAITFGNWVEYNANINVKIPPGLNITSVLMWSILLGHAEYGITAIMFIQSIRTALLYERSICRI